MIFIKLLHYFSYFLIKLYVLRNLCKLHGELFRNFLFFLLLSSQNKFPPRLPHRLAFSGCGLVSTSSHHMCNTFTCARDHEPLTTTSLYNIHIIDYLQSDFAIGVWAPLIPIAIFQLHAKSLNCTGRANVTQTFGLIGALLITSLI